MSYELYGKPETFDLFFHLRTRTYILLQSSTQILSCNETYIGETVRNTITRLTEHNNSLYDLEPLDTSGKILSTPSLGLF